MLTRLKKADSVHELLIFSGVKGLVSHGNDLKGYLVEKKPQTILVSISQEEVQGMAEFIKSPFEMNLSDYEVIYGVRLSKYGEVMTPPPIYTEAFSYSAANGIQPVGIDIPQQEFDRLYTDSMKTRHLIRHSLRKKRILNRDYRDTNEYEFVEAWIKKINSVRGLAAIDTQRSIYMASRIDDFSREKYVPNHLIIIDYEFYGPVMDELQQKGWSRLQA